MTGKQQTAAADFLAAFVPDCGEIRSEDTGGGVVNVWAESLTDPERPLTYVVSLCPVAGIGVYACSADTYAESSGSADQVEFFAFED